MLWSLWSGTRDGVGIWWRILFLFTSKEPPKSISKTSTIPGDDEPHETTNGHNATAQNANQHHSEDGFVKLGSSGKRGKNAERTERSDGETSESNKKRDTQLLLNLDGAMPLGPNSRAKKRGRSPFDKGLKKKGPDSNKRQMYRLEAQEQN
jgi:hypothetical protein